MQVINREELHSIFKKLKIEKQESVFNELYGKYNELDKVINKDSYNRLISKLNKKEQEIISF